MFCFLRAVIRFIWKRRSEGTFLEADPYRLEQILSNLLVNAAKYTDAGRRDLVQR